MDLEQVTESLLNFQAREVEFFSSDFPGTDSFPDLSGQVVTTLKPGASLFAWSDRELPLVAAWPFGRGRVAVITADGGQALAKKWSSEPEAWTRILARIMTSEREDTEIFYSPSGGLGQIHARSGLQPSGEGLAMVAGFPDGTMRTAPMEKIAADKYITNLNTPGSPPSILELRTADSERRLAIQIVPSVSAAAYAGTLRTVPFDPPPAGTQTPPERTHEPLVLRLLILLTVLLLAVDEFFRPPGMEEN
jgi:hypothetical protein